MSFQALPKVIMLSFLITIYRLQRPFTSHPTLPTDHQTRITNFLFNILSVSKAPQTRHPKTEFINAILTTPAFCPSYRVLILVNDLIIQSPKSLNLGSHPRLSHTPKLDQFPNLVSFPSYLLNLSLLSLPIATTLSFIH